MATTTRRDLISPRDFARAVGVSESSVKRWVDQGLVRATRTEGGHRRITREEAMRWIAERRLTPAEPEMIGLPATDHAAAARFEAALLARDEVEARRIALGLMATGHTVAAVGDHVIAPALHRIGHLWERGLDGVMREHQATDLTLRVVAAMRASLAGRPRPPSRTAPPAAVGGALTGDPYLVAPMLVSLTLGELGFEATHLGPDTPARVFELAAAETGARLVAISVGATLTADTNRELVALARRLETSGALLVLGGRALEARSVPPGPNVRVGQRLADLATILAEADG